MVRIGFIVLMISMSATAWNQNLSLGVGARVNMNWVESRDQFNFELVNIENDTLLMVPLNDGAASLTSGVSIPIYARYTSKYNWWAQLNYGYEVWRLEINGESVPTHTFIQNYVNEQMENAPNSLSEDEREELKETYTDEITEEGTTSFKSFERVQYNKLSLAVGSSLNRKGVITFFYGGGIDFYTASTLETYQGLVYDNEEVPRQYEILEAMPKLGLSIVSPFINFGIEKQNIRLGLDLAFYPGPVFGGHNEESVFTQPNGFSSQFVKNIKSVGVNLNYTLFNQNFNQAISADKKNVLDPVVIGKYRQKPKLIQLGASINFPNFRNSGWSEVDGLALALLEDIELDNDLKSKGDEYLQGIFFNKSENPNEDDIIDYLYLEKDDYELFVTDDDQTDTIHLSTTVFFDGGNINSIVKSPKVAGFVRINPHEFFSAEVNAGYQNHTYGIVAYETESERIGEETSVQTRKLVYQENFHELSLGIVSYGQMPINNISRVGFHIGINYNMWFNGNFIIEQGGVNDSELLQDFHDYNTGKLEGKKDPNLEEAEEWKGHNNLDNYSDADKGVFTKADYYDVKYNPNSNLDNYYTDYSPYLINTWQKRSYFELRFGLDYYIENLKFNIYAEQSLGRYQTMYSSLFTLGMGVSLFLN